MRGKGGLQEFVLLFFQLPHDKANELDIGVPHSSANLVRGGSSRSHPLSIGWLLWDLPIMLVHFLEQLSPASKILLKVC